MGCREISPIAYDNLVQALALNYSDLEAARSRLRNCAGTMADRIALKRQISDLIAARVRLVGES